MNTILYPSVSRLFDALPSADAFNSNRPLRVDIEESEGEYRIHADLPGVSKEDVRVNVEDNVLTIGAKFARAKSENDNKTLRRERLNGEVVRQFLLSPDVQAENINAALDGGVLTLTLPKGEDKRKRQIAIS